MVLFTIVLLLLQLAVPLQQRSAPVGLVVRVVDPCLPVVAAQRVLVLPQLAVPLQQRFTPVRYLLELLVVYCRTTAR